MIVRDTPAAERDLFARLPLGDVTTSIHPFGDSIGYLFTHQGRMYRAIRAEHAAFYRRLFETGVIGRLVDRGVLVPSEIVNERLPGFDFLIEHERLPHATYPTEWSTSMMREAALTTLDVQLELMQHGATLEDAHPWNIVFNGTQPVLVDLTAIKPATGAPRWEGEQTFRAEFMLPLQLMLHGRVGLAHLIATTDDADNWELWRLWRHDLAETIARVRARLGIAGSPVKRVESWRRAILASEPNGITPARATPSAAIVAHVRGWDVESVNIIGVSDESLALSIAQRGLRVVACTTDHTLAESIYRNARADRASVLPVIVDALAATSTFGAFARPSRAGAGTRLACDAAVLPGRRAVPSSDQQWMHLDQQIEAASVYASRYLAVELAGRDVSTCARWTELLQRHFAAPEVIVDPENDSHWVAGRIKRT